MQVVVFCSLLLVLISGCTDPGEQDQSLTPHETTPTAPGETDTPDSSPLVSPDPNECETPTALPTEDFDGDLFSVSRGDCDDFDYYINPKATEKCDYRDNDCDGFVDEDTFAVRWLDLDSDGYGNEALEDAVVDCGGFVEGYTFLRGDCDDFNPDIHPNAEEVCDDVDSDCSNSGDSEDNDGDGYSACDGDCNDAANNGGASQAPLLPEKCNGQDDNCDGVIDEGLLTRLYYVDYDLDGDGDAHSVGVLMCSASDYYWSSNDDCDDYNPFISGYTQEYCDGRDNNCDGEIDNIPESGVGAGPACVEKTCPIPDEGETR